MKSSKKFLMTLVLAVCPALPMTTIMAGIDTTSADLPPDGIYVTTADFFAMYDGPDLNVVLQDVVFKPLVNTVIRTAVGNDELETFDAILKGNSFEDVGSGPGGPFAFSLAGPVQTLVTNRLLSTTGLFDAEIVSMSLTGNLDLGSVLLRESPTLASMGQFDITDLGGGLYHIDSFFDVFTELSVDGGQTWIAADSSVRITLIPEPASVVLVLLGLGTMASRVRRRIF